MWDTGLLRQIRTELRGGVMSLEEIAALEGVSATALERLLALRLEPEPQPPEVTPQEARAMREFAGLHGLETVSWGASRGRASRLHLATPSGFALCGTPERGARIERHSGVCSMCFTYVRRPRKLAEHATLAARG
jgi:hypothetical protein